MIVNIGVNSIAGSTVGAQQGAKEREESKRAERDRPKVTRQIHDEFVPTTETERANADRVLKGNGDEETREDREQAGVIGHHESGRPHVDVQG